MYRNVRNSKSAAVSSPDTMNKMFIDATKNLKRDVPKIHICPTDLMPDNSYPGFTFSPVSTTDVRKAIISLKSSKTRDLYGMTTTIMKKCREPLLYPLKCLINAAIESGAFPDMLSDQYRFYRYSPKYPRNFCSTKFCIILMQIRYYLMRSLGFGRD